MMIWTLVGVAYVVMSLGCTAIIASVDAEYDWTENQPHLGASIILGAFWPLAMVYMLVYRAKRRAAVSEDRRDA